MATIDNLEIQIQSDSSSAVSSINELASSLNRIKNAVKGGIGLKSVSNQINELDSSLKSIVSVFRKDFIIYRNTVEKY